jgi:hypothetical protein
MFPIVGFYVRQILGILGFQIEREKIFSLFRILISFKKCLQWDNLDKLIFVNKNWSNDLRVGCKSPYCLVKLIEIDVDLKEELEIF